MPRKIQTNWTRYPSKTISAIGDSLTDNYGTGLLPDEEYPGQLAPLLNGLAGCSVKARNFGVSGNTTAQMVARCQWIFYPFAGDLSRLEIPDMAIVFGGANDPGNSIAQATTQANLQQIVRLLTNRCDAVVAGQANLPANPPTGLNSRYVVASDTSTTGGIDPTAVPGSPATRLGGSVTGITVWQCVTGAAGEAGWCRVANDPTRGVRRVIVMTTQFLNYAGGDTTTAQNASYASVRAAQQAAAAAEGVPCFDLWQYQANLISAGVETLNSSCWSYVASNQHPNLHGTQCWAMGLYNFTTMQPGWIAALTA